MHNEVIWILENLRDETLTQLVGLQHELQRGCADCAQRKIENIQRRVANLNNAIDRLSGES